MAKAKVKKFYITINADSNEQNARKEQFRVYQLDGETYQVPIGMSVEVPEWLAKRAKEIGDIPDYTVIEVDA